MTLVSHVCKNTGVLHFVPALDRRNTYGGPSSVAQDIVGEQRRRNTESMIFGAFRRGQRMELTSIPCRFFWGFQLGRSRKPGMIFSPGAIAWWLIHARGKVTHFHAAREPIALALMALAVILHRPYVIQLHGMLEGSTTGRLESRWLRYLLGKARHVWGLTETEVQIGTTVFRLRSISRLPNAIDLELQQKLKIPPAPVDVLFCARLHPRKGLVTFLRAAQWLQTIDPRASFTVVGPDEGDGWRIGAARAEGLQNIEYTGGVTVTESRHLISSASVLVVTAMHEPFGMTVLEALAQGTPVVAVAGGLLLEPELLAAGALTVTSDSPEALATAVGRMRSPFAADDQIRQGLQWCAKNASLKIVVDRIEACL